MNTTKRSGKYILGITALVGLMLTSLIIATQTRPSIAKAASAIGTNWYNAAPYVMPLANNPPSLTSVMSATGAKAFTLAFVVADSGCTPAWATDAGLTDVSSDTQMGPMINAGREAGRAGVRSFVGHGGTTPGQKLVARQAAPT